MFRFGEWAERIKLATSHGAPPERRRSGFHARLLYQKGYFHGK
jgi:hypothetical protein